MNFLCSSYHLATTVSDFEGRTWNFKKRKTKARYLTPARFKRQSGLDMSVALIIRAHDPREITQCWTNRSQAIVCPSVIDWLPLVCVPYLPALALPKTTAADVDQRTFYDWVFGLWLHNIWPFPCTVKLDGGSQYQDNVHFGISWTLYISHYADLLFEGQKNRRSIFVKSEIVDVKQCKSCFSRERIFCLLPAQGGVATIRAGLWFWRDLTAKSQASTHLMSFAKSWYKHCMPPRLRLTNLLSRCMVHLNCVTVCFREVFAMARLVFLGSRLVTERKCVKINK